MKKQIGKREWEFSLVIVSFILGLLLAAQFRTQQTIKAATPSKRLDELAVTLTEVEKEKDKMREEINDLRQKIQDYEKIATEGKSLMGAIKEELDKTRVMAGLTAVQGPGVIVKLQDSLIKAQPGEDPNMYLIHQEDILQVRNELFAAGAEAISINGQRMVSTSEVRCVGPTVIVNGTRLAPPYEISAIGNAKDLETALIMQGGIAELLEPVGIKLKIRKENNIQIPAYSGSLSFKYGKILENNK